MKVLGLHELRNIIKDVIVTEAKKEKKKKAPDYNLETEPVEPTGGGDVLGLPGFKKSDTYAYRNAETEKVVNRYGHQGSNPGWGPMTEGEKKIAEAIGEYLEEINSVNVVKHISDGKFWDAASNLASRKNRLNENNPSNLDWPVNHQTSPYWRHDDIDYSKQDGDNADEKSSVNDRKKIINGQKK